MRTEGHKRHEGGKESGGILACGSMLAVGRRPLRNRKAVARDRAWGETLGWRFINAQALKGRDKRCARSDLGLSHPFRAPPSTPETLGLHPRLRILPPLRGSGTVPRIDCIACTPGSSSFRRSAALEESHRRHGPALLPVRKQKPAAFFLCDLRCLLFNSFCSLPISDRPALPVLVSSPVRTSTHCVETLSQAADRRRLEEVSYRHVRPERAVDP